jgi:hypothetical protein
MLMLMLVLVLVLVLVLEKVFLCLVSLISVMNRKVYPGKRRLFRARV